MPVNRLDRGSPERTDPEATIARAESGRRASKKNPRQTDGRPSHSRRINSTICGLESQDESVTTRTTHTTVSTPHYDLSIGLSSTCIGQLAHYLECDVHVLSPLNWTTVNHFFAVFHPLSCKMCNPSRPQQVAIEF